MDTVFFLKFLSALFAIMNPFVNLPVFLSLTDGLDRAAQRRTGLAVVAYSAGLCAMIALAGRQVLGFFGISVADFRVAGGLVLVLIGLGMLHGEASSAHHGTAAEQDQQAEAKSIAFYPLSFPMLVGPGTITTLVIFAGQAHGPGQALAIAAGCAAVLAALAVVLCFAASIGRYLSQTLRVVMIRLMGMILVAMAVGMIADGLKTLLPGLG